MIYYIVSGPYPEVDGGGGGYSLVLAATPFLGVFNLQNVYFSLAPGGGGGTDPQLQPPARGAFL